MQKRFDYVAMIEAARNHHKLTIRALATKSGIGAAKLGSVLNYKSKLNREQAFFLGTALEISPVDMERLALLTVYALATRPAFKNHILGKLTRIESIRDQFSWTDYIASTLPKSLKSKKN